MFAAKLSVIVPGALCAYQTRMSQASRPIPPQQIAALIVAAGRGTRLGGDVPKQYQALAGEMVLTRTLRAFAATPRVQRIVVVHHPDDSDLLAEALATVPCPVTSVPGGATRDASVRAGLTALRDGVDAVLIHDAARPLVRPETIAQVIGALDCHDGAAPGLAVLDALWQGGETVAAIQPRAGLFRAQTPQGFHLAAIRAAHAAHPGGAADDVEVGLAHGLDIAIVPGDEENLKLTRPGDFDRAARILEGRAMIDIRTGNGVDVHRFGPGDHVILCGVRIEHGRGLQGHSDADVGLHAVTDAIYGALAKGDIGTHFPPSDPRWKGAESHVFLTHAVDLAAREGFTITHADLTFLCERPKIGPHAAAMRAALSRLLRIELARASVKATTTERLGFTGREEGIAAMATVTLVKA